MAVREIRAPGPGQRSERHARSIMAAQRERQEARLTLLPDVWSVSTARQAVVAVCNDHQHAGFWLRHQRVFTLVLPATTLRCVKKRETLR